MYKEQYWDILKVTQRVLASKFAIRKRTKQYCMPISMILFIVRSGKVCQVISNAAPNSQLSAVLCEQASCAKVMCKFNARLTAHHTKQDTDWQSKPHLWKSKMKEECASNHLFHETCHSITFYFMKKKTLNDAVTSQHHSQFTPKVKANVVPRLLSSLVWIDQYNEM